MFCLLATKVPKEEPESKPFVPNDEPDPKEDEPNEKPACVEELGDKVKEGFVDFVLVGVTEKLKPVEVAKGLDWVAMLESGKVGFVEADVFLVGPNEKEGVVDSNEKPDTDEMGRDLKLASDVRVLSAGSKAKGRDLGLASDVLSVRGSKAKTRDLELASDVLSVGGSKEKDLGTVIGLVAFVVVVAGDAKTKGFGVSAGGEVDSVDFSIAMDGLAPNEKLGVDPA
jgi:hypothetical protein